MAATSHLNEARLFKVKSEFLLNLGIAMKKNTALSASFNPNLGGLFRGSFCGGGR